MNNYDWLDKKTSRTVDNLKLWPDNPRLNPEGRHIRVTDFADDLISEEADKSAFIDLVKSIANDGFRPYDPIIVWKNEENNNFYVAEGNRRVLALKLLIDPNKAPKAIRSTIRKYSDKIDIESIKKIRVNVAPDFENAEWYINQRNNTSSLHRPWTRTQQQRWILELYDKYGGDINVVGAKTNFTPSELEGYIRPLKIRDFVLDEEIKKHLSTDEIIEAKSLKFPITILERFFAKAEARQKFKIEYDGINIICNGNKESFFIAFSELIERIIKRETTYKNSRLKIDTRTLTTNFNAILDSLPEVSLEVKDIIPSESKDDYETNSENKEDNNVNDSSINIKDSVSDNPTEISLNPISPVPDPAPSRVPLKNNPNRNNIVLDIYKLNTDKARLLGIFNEFKLIPLSRYPHTIASALRVFLDLAVIEYIESENLTVQISTQYKAEFKEVTLKKRLEYLKTNSSSNQFKNIIGTLLTSGQQFSLDVLNGFVHGRSTHYIDKQFLNKFWDFLFPLFEELLDIEEK